MWFNGQKFELTWSAVLMDSSQLNLSYNYNPKHSAIGVNHPEFSEI